MIKFRHFLVIFASFVISSFTSAQTLREAVQQAMSIHPEILLNHAQTSAARQGINEAKGAYYPSVDINSSYGSEWTESPFTQDLVGDQSTSLKRREFNIALVQNLYAGGAIIGEVDRNVFIFRSQDFKTVGVINDIVLGVTEAYLDVLLERKLIEVAEKNLAVHQRLLTLVKERSVAGISRKAELDQAESRVSQAEANLIGAEGNQQEAMVHFKKLVGVWPDKLIDPMVPPDGILPKTLDAAIREGFDNHPFARAAEEDIKQAKAQRQISDAAFLPKIDAVFSTSRNGNLDGIPGPNNDRSGQIRLSYNAFKGGADLSRLRKTAYQVQEAFETRDKTLIELREKIQLDYNSWNINRKRANILSNYVVSIDKTRVAYFEQFKIGQRTFLDLLNSQNETYRSKVDYLQSSKDEIEARFRILNGIGRLVLFFAEQKDPHQVHPKLFTLPKAPDDMIKTIADSPPAFVPLNTVADQPITPTGNTRLVPIDLSLPKTIPQAPTYDAPQTDNTDALTSSVPTFSELLTPSSYVAPVPSFIPAIIIPNDAEKASSQ